MIHHGDCLDVLRTLPNASVDACVTDPPYGLSFMGKRWDYDVPSVEVWAECLRVLKPGGHLLAFAGTRTQHRMAVRIEDAGFEIRDMIAWVYCTGFPKSHNLDRFRGYIICGCDAATKEVPGKSSPERDLYSLRDADVSSSVDTGEWRREVLQPRLSEQGAPSTGWAELSGSEVRFGEPSLEGRRDIPQTARELRLGEVYPLSAGVHVNGSQGRLCDGASSSDGDDGAASVAPDGMRASSRPQPSKQLSGKSGIVAVQSQPQDGRVWPLCGRCGKQRIPSGLGTALKPALEPITVARKPLAGTVAENVLRHGTGGLNIDGCRVATDETFRRKSNVSLGCASGGIYGKAGAFISEGSPLGRWPANLIHDGSEEVVACFPNSNGSGAARTLRRGQRDSEGWGMADQAGELRDAGTGSAARFFYCAKASKADREEGLAHFPAKRKAGAEFRPNHMEKAEQGESGNPYGRWNETKNTHPTVKPTDLMRYLVRLVTPPGGVVLDPFMGSGSTGKACALEGFQFIGIEREAEYVEIARCRIDNAKLPLMRAAE